MVTIPAFDVQLSLRLHRSEGTNGAAWFCEPFLFLRHVGPDDRLGAHFGELRRAGGIHTRMCYLFVHCRL